jgi:predicted CXXCH cytochrome family protein
MNAAAVAQLPSTSLTAKPDDWIRLPIIEYVSTGIRMKQFCHVAIAIYCALLAVAGGLSHPAQAATSTCAKCHQGETARYLATAMGKSLVAPESLPPGKITHDPSHSVITIEERNATMVHTLNEAGLTAEYPVQYQMGGGLMGSSFLVQIGDYLFESPASWFNSYGWDISPGYAPARFIDFDRPMNDACLFCHAGNARFSDADGRRLRTPDLSAIGCERCHGPGTEHIRQPTAKNIVNPAKLTQAARDSVCEQCHLEAAGRVLNPGKHWDDFHAGTPAEKTFATYMLVGGDNHEVIAVSQVEQLAQSQCARMSGGKLWCGTCHDPHGQTKNRQEEMKTICTTCHLKLQADHPAAPAECTSCHMPRGPTTNIAHAALTDHRILRRPENPISPQPGPEKVVAWREPPLPVRTRDLALAELLAALSDKSPSLQEEGFSLLTSMPAEKRANDPDAISALEGLYLQKGDFANAIKFGQRTVALSPRSAKAAMNFAIVLQRSGDLAAAERQFTRAIELDPSMKAAYGQLAILYAKQGRSQEMMDIMDRYLKWNPQDITFRMQKQRQANQ